MKEKILSEELIKISTMYESLRYNEYTIENGIGEIVDNSVEAGASIVSIEVKKNEVRERGKKKEIIEEIAIIDDGCGMDEEILSKCLVLGESIRSNRNGKLGIGRFGVGMTLGSISLARKVEVYSRKSSDEDFMYTYIDLDEIRECIQDRIYEPIKKMPRKEYFEVLKNTSGTIVILSNCDRLVKNVLGRTTDANEIIKKLANYLGRTYRKFIYAGLDIKLDGNKVFLHDPLYIMGPTIFDTKDHVEPKAIPQGETKISLEIPGSNGKKADITVTMSLLPEEWRKNRGDGGNDAAKKRKIDQNEGISILRANREVLYAHVPYTTGKRGESKAKDIDRFWGCEVSFPPELDDYFQVRYIKRGAEPIESLRKQLLEIIGPAVKTLRSLIQESFNKNEFNERKDAGEYSKAEDAMEKASKSFPLSKKGSDISKDEEEKVIEGIVDNLQYSKDEDEKKKREEKKEKIQSQPYSIEMVSYPTTILFEPEYLLDKIVLKINIKHPFYEKVIKPLCGDLQVLDEDSQGKSNKMNQVKDAIMLLLLSYSKAESMFSGDEELFENLRTQWGTFLRTVINEYVADKK